jgi:chromosomal replication initiator protein
VLNDTRFFDFLTREANASDDLTKKQIDILSNFTSYEIYDDNVIFLVSNKDEKVVIERIIDFFLEPICSRYFNKDLYVFIKVYNIKKDIIKITPKPSEVEIIKQNHPSNFEKDFTFENFIQGESNKVVLLAINKIMSSLGCYANPLYIYGESGLGKTYLLKSIQTQLSQKSSFSCIYTTADSFVDDFVLFSKKKDLDSFYHKYKSRDILLFDDFQYLTDNMGGSKTAFLNILNYFIDNNKQIIIASQVNNNEIKLDSTLIKTRINAGLNIKISPIDKELKKKFILYFIKNNITKKDDLKNWKNEYIDKLVKVSGDNFREIIGFLTKILFFCDINNQPISQKIIDLTIKESYSDQKDITLIKIQKVVANFYSVEEKDVTGNSRVSEITKARHIIMYLTRKLTDLTSTQIGKHFKKDHSAVLASEKKVEQLIKTNKRIELEIEEISKIIKKL